MDKKFVVTKQLSKFFLLLSVLLMIFTSFQAYASSERYQIVEGGSIVRDLVTGLEWQRCSVGQTWNGSTCVGVASVFNWNATKRTMTDDGFVWPTIDQLTTLIYCSNVHSFGLSDKYIACNGNFSIPTINSVIFPNTPAGWFLSSSVTNGNFLSAHFSYGRVFEGQTSSGALRLVRDTSRYEFLENGGVVRDLITGLEWQRCSVGQTWDGNNCIGNAVALSWYEASAIKTADDFSLPSLGQIASLIYCSNTEKYGYNATIVCHPNSEYYSSPTIHTYVFPQTEQSTYWSSSLSSHLGNVSSYVDFRNGSSYRENLNSKKFVRLVRVSPISERYAIIEEGNVIRDLVTGLEWKRCLEGQVWSGSACIGLPKGFLWDEALLLSSPNGFSLPDLAQLSSLVFFSDTGEFGAKKGDVDYDSCENGRHKRPAMFMYESFFSDTDQLPLWSSTLTDEAPVLVNFYNGCYETGTYDTRVGVRLVRISQREVSAVVSVGGAINQNIMSVSNGQVAEFTLTPDEGYKINPRVKGSCLQGQWINENTYQTGTIVSNCTIEFGFNEIKRNARKGLPVWLLVQ